MKKVAKFLIGSIYDVLRLVLLGLLAAILIWLFLFSVDLDFRNYDIVFTSRINSSMYYGIEYGEKFEIWKIEKADDASLYTRRLYP